MTDTNKVEVEPTCKKDLQVWVTDSGQFSWEQQDERYWTKCVPASALAALRAENERLEEQKEHYIEQWSEVCNENQGLLNKLEAAQADAARMREALEMIAWSNDSKWQADAARAALEPKT